MMINSADRMTPASSPTKLRHRTFISNTPFKQESRPLLSPEARHRDCGGTNRRRKGVASGRQCGTALDTRHRKGRCVPFPMADEASRATLSARTDKPVEPAGATHWRVPQLSASGGLSGHHTRSYTALVSCSFESRSSQGLSVAKQIYSFPPTHSR